MFLLIDGSNLAHRALHSFYGANGYYSYIDAVPGFLSRLNTSVEYHCQSAAVLVAWDLGLPLHRRELHSEYKPDSMPVGKFDPRLMSEINMDPELCHRASHGNQNFQQEYKKLIKILSEQIIPNTNTYSVKIANCEADDIIATFVYYTKGLESQIISSDRDLIQLVNKKVSLYTFSGSESQGNIYDWDWVTETFEIPSSFRRHFLLQKAIMGDTSDNIPKIDKISEKTAKAYSFQIINSLKQGKSFEEAFLSLERPERATKLGLKNLQEGIDLVKNNYKLMDLFYPIQQDLNMSYDIRSYLRSLANFKPDYYKSLENLEKIEGLDHNKFMSSFESLFLSNSSVERGVYLEKIK